MCGIFLVYSKKKKLNKNRCYSAISSISKRGPDRFLSNYFLNEKLFMFNSVLSITGSVEKRKNLYTSENKRYYLSFNGEIFNYKNLQKKFLGNNNKLSNDSKVLVNLFQVIKNKIKISKKINGMFSYVVFDKLEKKIIFSTDVQGEKRLYKYEDNENFILSSTIKSVLAFIKKKDLNIEALKNYFCTRHLLIKDNTIYKNLSIIEQGNYFEHSFKTKRFTKKQFDNPLNWIDKKKYQKFNNMSENEIIEFFHKIFLKQLKLMIPKVKFGSICSGGIDSSLQTAMINKINKDFIIGTIHHKKKDKITEDLSKFENRLNKKIHKYYATIEKNKKIASRCVNEIGIPFLTHDFIGRYQISNFFKKKDCKVFFGGDGADELFGGYELYKKVNWNSKETKNLSPYSQFNYKSYVVPTFNKLKTKMHNFYLKTHKKYSFLNNNDRNIQSSLFTDYFLSAISVYNIGNDLVCCSHAIEPRNLFIQKEILKNAVNLPAKYKINKSNIRSAFKLKPLLKKIFLKYYPTKLIFKKQGFSGYPNELKPILRDKKFSIIKKKNILKNIKLNNDKKLEWKLVNLQIYFEKFFNNVFV